MKSLRRRAIAAVLVVCALQPRHADARGGSTPDERAHFVALVRLLETQPLGENANATRQRLREWVTEVPDIRFKVCADLLGQVLSSDYPYAREIALQVLLSGAVLTIEHPGEARDDVAVYTAGVEGALRAYEAMVKSTPNARLAALDDLVVRRDRGELVDYIARLAKENCKRSNLFLIATPIGAAVGLVLALLVAHWFGGWRHVSTRVATLFRRIVLICVAYYITALIALHFLEPEYDPRYHFMSDYAWGAYGWLMTTTFFVLGLGLLTVAVGLRGLHQSPRSARIGFGLLSHRGAVHMPRRRIQGISSSRRRWRRGDSEPRHGGAPPVLELPEGAGMAGDPSGHFSDRRRNARCARVDGPRHRDAGLAAACPSVPVAVMAFDRRPPLGWGNSWSGPTARSIYDVNAT